MPSKMERIILVPVPTEDFQQELLANAIGEKIKLHVINLCHQDMSRAAEILKSPALFGLSESFMVKEYLKNTADVMTQMKKEGKLPKEEALTVEFCLRVNEDKSVQSLVRDTGSGFPDSFLKRNDGESMVDYRQKKLIGADGKVLSNITSEKSVKTNEAGEKVLIEDKNGIKGGRGLGLATGARISDITNRKPTAVKAVSNIIYDEVKHEDILPVKRNNMKVGNVNDLPQDIKSELNLTSEQDHGAVILYDAKPFKEKQLTIFKHLKDEGQLQKYCKYAEAISEKALFSIMGNADEINERLEKLKNQITQDVIKETPSPISPATTSEDRSESTTSNDAEIKEPVSKLKNVSEERISETIIDEEPINSFASKFKNSLSFEGISVEDKPSRLESEDEFLYATAEDELMDEYVVDLGNDDNKIEIENNTDDPYNDNNIQMLEEEPSFQKGDITIVVKTAQEKSPRSNRNDLNHNDVENVNNQVNTQINSTFSANNKPKSP